MVPVIQQAKQHHAEAMNRVARALDLLCTR
jgi:hypothetical protein